MNDAGDADPEVDSTEVFESYDEVAEAGSTGPREDPGVAGGAGEQDLTRLADAPSDRRANEALGAQLDDPERMAVLDGGMDDPDGTGATATDLGKDNPGEDDPGWDLDAGER